MICSTYGKRVRVMNMERSPQIDVNRLVEQKKSSLIQGIQHGEFLYNILGERILHSVAEIVEQIPEIHVIHLNGDGNQSISIAASYDWIFPYSFGRSLSLTQTQLHTQALCHT